MNKTVSINEVKGLVLKMKDAETNTAFKTISSNDWNQSAESPEVIFDLGSPNDSTSVAKNLIVGKYYKIQLAFMDEGGSVGYYSTIAITKYTSKPVLSILNLNRYATNNDISEYVGQYTNLNDVTEKAYQYKFTFRDMDGEVLETTEWKIHNANTNSEMGISTDSYHLMHVANPDQKYTMQYSVLTNNGLEISSPKYQIVGTTSIMPELSASLIADLDYDNGCVNLRLDMNALAVIDPVTNELEAPKLTGSFLLSRSSAAEKYSIWTKIYSFNLTGQLPEGPIFTDYTCEHGETYHYAIQQFNPNGIFSNRMLATTYWIDEYDRIQRTDDIDIIVNFEDMFLYDGNRQLRVRFNPKVSSFKTVVQDSKKNTLGSQFPFFFRNGLTEYKEFPISGLISYMIDENEFFLNRVNDLNMPVTWQDCTDITDDNLIYERKFKLAVLDWLNDGQIKLFRSPAEGNYLVRLMNVTLSPNDTVSRMIHTFSCTATEIDEYTSQKLSDYGFLQASLEVPKQLRFGTFVFADYIEDLISKAERSGSQHPVDEALAAFKEYDILRGFACQYIHLEDIRPSTEFQLNRRTFQVGATGSYEATFTDNPRGLYVTNPYRYMEGSITYGVLTAMSNSFDTVTAIKLQDILDYPAWSYMDYISQHNNIKDKINKIYFMHFALNDLVYTFANIDEFNEHYHMYMSSEHEEWYNGGHLKEDPEFDATNTHYMVFLEGTCSAADKYKYLDDYYHFEIVDYDENEQPIYEYKYIQRGAQDLYVNNSLIYLTGNGNIYRYTVHSIGDHYGVYGILTYLGTDSDATGQTKIYLNDKILDISLTGSLYVPFTEEIPTMLRWGPMVQATICYQQLTIDYGVENNFVPMLDWNKMSMIGMKQVVEESKKLYDAYHLQLIPRHMTTALKKAIKNVHVEDTEAYFIWNGQRFHRLTIDERVSVTDNTEIWTCFTRWQYDSDLGYCIYRNDLHNNTLYDYTKQIEGAWVGASLYESHHTTYLSMVEQQLIAEEKELIFSDE